MNVSNVFESVSPAFESDLLMAFDVAVDGCAAVLEFIVEYFDMLETSENADMLEDCAPH